MSLAISILFLLLLFVSYYGQTAYIGFTVFISGYKILFASPESFAGFILILSLWIVFLCNLYLIIESSTKLISPAIYENIDGEVKKKINKFLNIACVLGLVLQLCALFSNFKELRIGFYLITIIFFIRVLIEIKMKKIENKENSN